jgi:hypothetical protein
MQVLFATSPPIGLPIIAFRHPAAVLELQQRRSPHTLHKAEQNEKSLRRASQRALQVGELGVKDTAKLGN